MVISNSKLDSGVGLCIVMVPVLLEKVQRDFEFPNVTGGLSKEIGDLMEGKKLLRVVERWLRDERERQKQEELENPGAKLRRAGAVKIAKQSEPIMPSKHMAFFR